MKFLVVSQYFWPESFIINDLAKTLRDQGHSVVVATGKPNYPEGRVFEGYTATGTQRETYDGDIDVVRVPLRPRGTGRANLALNYLSFVWSGLREFPRLLETYSFDAILVFAPSPITMAITAVPIKWRKGAHLAIWIQDLWPQSLASTGYVRSRLVLSFVGLLARAIYASADTLLVQSRAFVDPVAKYARRDKIVFYPNSAPNPDPSVPAANAPPALVALLRRHFCVMFAGNIGRAQSIETIVEAAKRLRDLPDLRIVMVGNGTMLPWLEQQKTAHGLDQLVLAGRLPMAVMPAIYNEASCLVVTLRADPFLSTTIPSKVQAYLAAGKPIIAALDGEGARVIVEAGAGLVCPPEDPDALATAIREMYAMSPEDRAARGRAGHRYFLDHFEIRSQAIRLVELFEQRIATTRSRR